MLRFAALLAFVFLQLAAGVVGSPTPVPELDKRAGACSFIRVRKEWRGLTASEKQNFISSVLCLQSRPAKVTGKAGVKTRFDEFQACHIDLTDEVHQVGHFLAWHRHFITMFDRALRDECGFTGIMPYWDWSIDADATKAMKDSVIFDPTTGFGGDGVSGTYTLPPDPNGQSSAFPFAYKGCVRTGPFANHTVRLGPGRLVTDHCLVRGIDEASKQALASSQVNRVMQLTPFERFRTGLENGIAAGFGFGIHGGGHQAVGGEMLNPYSSPADPLFYLHHGNLDRLWWQWQRVDRTARMFDISGPTSQRPPFTNVTLDFQMTFTTLGPLVPVLLLLFNSCDQLATSPDRYYGPPDPKACQVLMDRHKFTEQSSASMTSLLGDHDGQNKSAVSAKYSLSPSPHSWNAPLTMDVPEPDDALHNPDPRRDRMNDNGGHIFTSRGIANLGCLFILALGILMLFAGFPLLSHFLTPKLTTQGGFNLGGINATGQIAKFPGNFGLIDEDTPREAYTRKSYMPNGEDLVLVFSDEFNEDGRTFYPGDDPFWEAVDLHYWGTNDLEWYDPSGATTKDGTLHLTLERVNDTASNHDLQYRSGMIQSWNKFCFTGGLLEASVRLPGSTNVGGLWPAVWAMGNLGRAGFGGSLDGMWPYTYDSCDVGTLPNQTYPGTRTPEAAVSGGDRANGDVLSYLPGQRLSACTCPGESHPGPMRPDGSYVGRAAPEIDVFEALVENGVGMVSVSAQWAPYNAGYNWANTSANFITYDDTTHLNAYKGGVYQQTTSCLSRTNQDCYELEGGCHAVYGFEYKPGFDDGYITWINDDKAVWTITSDGMGRDDRTEIGPRPIPQEPMYIIANLGFSLNFGNIDFDNLQLPTYMSIDYIRVYQRKGEVNIGCDPVDFPTSDYINTYYRAYTNPNITTWQQFEQPWPKNRLATADGCK